MRPSLTSKFNSLNEDSLAVLLSPADACALFDLTEVTIAVGFQSIYIYIYIYIYI